MNSVRDVVSENGYTRSTSSGSVMLPSDADTFWPKLRVKVSLATPKSSRRRLLLWGLSERREEKRCLKNETSRPLYSSVLFTCLSKAHKHILFKKHNFHLITVIAKPCGIHTVWTAIYQVYDMLKLIFSDAETAGILKPWKFSIPKYSCLYLPPTGNISTVRYK